ncbi:hypothetical protein ALC56_00145 [Trachymyrmex septentrionalis]|uniref:Uncharacterized protein n=1 Tax=Trachymyrmex septentrionalis TaxID=34720 RepID=A0A151K1E7_9HYME|nr:hypothetical protein ALC56_00145 [Trachymyrmex septentrionalis]
MKRPGAREDAREHVLLNYSRVTVNARGEGSGWFFNQPLKEITHRSKRLRIIIQCKEDIMESSKVVRPRSGGNSSDILRHCAVTCHALSRSSRARPARSLAPA